MTAFSYNNDISFRIHIEPIQHKHTAAGLDTVVKVLSKLMESYNNYIAIESFKNDRLKKYIEDNNSLLDTLQKELQLFIVDLNFGSFEAALAIDIPQDTEISLFHDDVTEWKNKTYLKYKKNFIEDANYEDEDYVSFIEKSYTPYERAKIFKPLFESFGDNKTYRLNINDATHKTVKTLRTPKNKKFYIPKSNSQMREQPQIETYQVAVKLKTENGSLDTFQKISIKDALYVEKLVHDTYPFKPDIIKYKDKVFPLSEKLNCTVDFEDGFYTIENEDLNILVWAESRQEAEDAFYFSFYALYDNYYNEDDSNLSEEAVILKNKLRKYITNILQNESKKN